MMADQSNPQLFVVERRRRGRPRVATPRTITLSIRLKTSEYDALCQRARAAGEDVAALSRALLRLPLNPE